MTQHPFLRSCDPADIKVSRCVKLTQDLRKRMNEYRDHINYSAIAVAAWESAIRDIEASDKALRTDRIMDGLSKTMRLLAEKPE